MSLVRNMYDLCLDYVWIPWYLYGLRLYYVLIVCELGMNYVRTTCGLCLDYQWNMYGLCTVYNLCRTIMLLGLFIMYCSRSFINYGYEVVHFMNSDHS